ncbi:MAG: penicillin acylase family protein, partial [Chloroflexota bacterium]|nr:penicillin acylase family protein [Chloroflexota bacterium]
LGSQNIGLDFFFQRLGLVKVAQAMWEGTEPERQAWYRAYAAGVNHHIEGHRDSLPPEFERLGIEPEPWEPQHSLMFWRAMSWFLSSGAFEEKAIFAQLMLEIGPTKAADVCGGEPADPITIVRQQEAAPEEGQTFLEKARDALEGLSLALRRLGISATRIGSNNWVIDGHKSTTGRPILANDPHLNYPNPSILHEVHLTCGDLNVIGATAAGYLDVAIGHNEHIAWGLTTCPYDVADLYLETIDPQDSSRYLFRGQSLPFETEEMVVRCRTEDGIREERRTLRHTVHGPVLLDNIAGRCVTLKWTGFQPSHEDKAFQLAARATNLTEFKEALRHIRVGAQNFVYADVQGNIFWMAPAAIPIRTITSLYPLDGASGNCEWQGFVPWDDLPRAENPPEHFIATANNRPVGPDYPYYIGDRFDRGLRARRIRDRLLAQDKLSFEDMQDIQFDVYVLNAERFKGHILDAAAERPDLCTGKVAEALTLVKTWDNQATVDSVGCTVFHAWLKWMVMNLIGKQVSQGLRERLCMLGRVPLAVLERLLAGKTNHDWLGEMGMSLSELILRSLADAVADLEEQLGPETSTWQWGRFHTLLVIHALGDFSLGPFPIDGSIDTVHNAVYPLLARTAPTEGGPAMCMCVDVEKGMWRADNVIPGGQSGHPHSPHHQDQLRLWLDNRCRPMLFDRRDIEANTELILRLRPADSRSASRER